MDWLVLHWFDTLQTIGIISGLAFTAHASWREERSRKIGNLIAINHQYQDIWKELYERPKLSRVMENDLDLDKEPITVEETLFVSLLIQHLHTVHRATQKGMFVRVEGIRKDIQRFFAHPIPEAIWNNSKSLQDGDFVNFVEASRLGK